MSLNPQQHFQQQQQRLLTPQQQFQQQQFQQQQQQQQQIHPSLSSQDAPPLQPFNPDQQQQLQQQQQQQQLQPTNTTTSSVQPQQQHITSPEQPSDEQQPQQPTQPPSTHSPSTASGLNPGLLRQPVVDHIVTFLQSTFSNTNKSSTSKNVDLVKLLLFLEDKDCYSSEIAEGFARTVPDHFISPLLIRASQRGFVLSQYCYCYLLVLAKRDPSIMSQDPNDPSPQPIAMNVSITQPELDLLEAELNNLHAKTDIVYITKPDNKKQHRSTALRTALLTSLGVISLIATTRFFLNSTPSGVPSSGSDARITSSGHLTPVVIQETTKVIDHTKQLNQLSEYLDVINASITQLRTDNNTYNNATKSSIEQTNHIVQGSGLIIEQLSEKIDTITTAQSQFQEKQQTNGDILVKLQHLLLQLTEVTDSSMARDVVTIRAEMVRLQQTLEFFTSTMSHSLTQVEQSLEESLRPNLLKIYNCLEDMKKTIGKGSTQVAGEGGDENTNVDNNDENNTNTSSEKNDKTLQSGLVDGQNTTFRDPNQIKAIENEQKLTKSLDNAFSLLGQMLNTPSQSPTTSTTKISSENVENNTTNNHTQKESNDEKNNDAQDVKDTPENQIFTTPFSLLNGPMISVNDFISGTGVLEDNKKEETTPIDQPSNSPSTNNTTITPSTPLTVTQATPTVPIVSINPSTPAETPVVSETLVFNQDVSKCCENCTPLNHYKSRIDAIFTQIRTTIPTPGVKPPEDGNNTDDTKIDPATGNVLSWYRMTENLKLLKSIRIYLNNIAKTPTVEAKRRISASNPTIRSIQSSEIYSSFLTTIGFTLDWQWCSLQLRCSCAEKKSSDDDTQCSCSCSHNQNNNDELWNSPELCGTSAKKTTERLLTESCGCGSLFMVQYALEQLNVTLTGL